MTARIADKKALCNGSLNNNLGNVSTLLGPYRVLDLSDERGTLCGRILASMGADVIKIEPPGGAPLRGRAPFYRDAPGPENSLAWWALEANKRSLTLDIGHEGGRSLLRQLALTADFLIESFEPGFAASQGLGYDDLHAHNPALVYVSITPFGQTGPRSRWAASDITIQATSGHMYLNGEPDRSPVRLGVSAAYWHGGAEGAQGAMVAHHVRRRTGRGQHVDVSMQQAHIWTLLNTTMTWQLARRQEIRGGSRRKERGHNYYSRHIWSCKDGAVHFVPIAGGGGKSRQHSYTQLMELMKADGFYEPFLDAKDWNGKDMFGIIQAEYDSIAERIAAYFMTKTVTELYDFAVNRQLLLAPLASTKDLLESRQLENREFFVDVHHPRLGRPFSYPGGFAKFSATPLMQPRPAPHVGEHTVEILQELGLTEREIVELRAEGCI
jgi:crotonobetainyl-CoA:carnitine CoA-transferase CaiB-like acyl-CoA transferase